MAAVGAKSASTETLVIQEDNYIIVFGQPPLVTLPLVVAWFLLLCKFKRDVNGRKLYYRTRLYAFVTSIVINLAHVAYIFYYISNNYDVAYCPNPYGTKAESFAAYEAKRNENIEKYGGSTMLEFKDLEDW